MDPNQKDSGNELCFLVQISFKLSVNTRLSPTVGKAGNCMDWIARGVEGSGCCVLVNGPDWIGARRQLQTRGASRSAARLGRRCPLAKIRFGAASDTRKESGESFKLNIFVSPVGLLCEECVRNRDRSKTHIPRTGVQKSFHPTIPDGSTWNKFGARGEHGEHGKDGKHGDVLQFSN